MHPLTMVAAVVPRPPWDWGTMAAIVGNLSHDVSIDVVGCCDVCFAR
jgi:hypothetical protein